MSAVNNRIAVLHGVNLDTLGRRNEMIYSDVTLGQLEVQVRNWAHDLGLGTLFFQTNHEGEFVEHLHRSPELADGILINAGAWTHYSWGIRDALEVAGLPAIEVHISDVQAREEWRRQSVFDGLVAGVVSGKGVDGYREALELLVAELKEVEA